MLESLEDRQGGGPDTIYGAEYSAWEELILPREERIPAIRWSLGAARGAFAFPDQIGGCVDRISFASTDSMSTSGVLAAGGLLHPCRHHSLRPCPCYPPLGDLIDNRASASQSS